MKFPLKTNEKKNPFQQPQNLPTGVKQQDSNWTHTYVHNLPTCDDQQQGRKLTKEMSAMLKTQNKRGGQFTNPKCSKRLTGNLVGFYLSIES